MREKYWEIFCDEVPCELGIEITQEQKENLKKAILGGIENESLNCGYEEADRSLDRINKSENYREIISIVEDLIADMDGSASIVSHLTENQKIALGKLFNFRDYVQRFKKITL